MSGGLDDTDGAEMPACLDSTGSPVPHAPLDGPRMPWLRMRRVPPRRDPSNRGNPPGAILIDVLISLGLISTLAVFLLSVLLNARKMDEALTKSLDAYHETTVLYELLKTDLAHSRAIAVAGLDDTAGRRSSSLLLLQDQGEADVSTIQYDWKEDAFVLMRTVLLTDGRAMERGLSVDGAVEFEILRSASDDGGGVGAEGVVVYVGSGPEHPTEAPGDFTSREHDVAEDAARTLSFPFPVPVDVIDAKDLRL